MSNFNLKIKTGVRGRFRLFTTDETGKITKDTGFFNNLITNGGLDQIANYVPYSTAYSTPYLGTVAFVGTGNTPPAYTDTSLTSYLASSTWANSGAFANSVYTPAGTNPGYISWTATYIFPAGTATGTLAEVGIGEIASPSPGINILFSHALIVDGSGNPTTITVLANEQLNVVYELQLIIDPTIQTGTITYNSVTYNLSWLPANVNNSTIGPISMSDTTTTSQWEFFVFNGTIQGITQGPTGTQTQNGTAPVLSSYTSGNYYITATWSGGINDWNLSGGISAVMVQSNLGFPYQIGISPAIPKTNFYSMTFSCTFSWNRYP